MVTTQRPHPVGVAESPRQRCTGSACQSQDAGCSTTSGLAASVPSPRRGPAPARRNRRRRPARRPPSAAAAVRSEVRRPPRHRLRGAVNMAATASPSGEQASARARVAPACGPARAVKLPTRVRRNAVRCAAAAEQLTEVAGERPDVGAGGAGDAHVQRVAGAFQHVEPLHRHPARGELDVLAGTHPGVRPDAADLDRADGARAPARSPRSGSRRRAAICCIGDPRGRAGARAPRPRRRRCWCVPRAGSWRRTPSRRAAGDRAAGWRARPRRPAPPSRPGRACRHGRRGGCRRSAAAGRRRRATCRPAALSTMTSPPATGSRAPSRRGRREAESAARSRPMICCGVPSALKPAASRWPRRRARCMRRPRRGDHGSARTPSTSRARTLGVLPSGRRRPRARASRG